ncbi:hypothetical protein ACXHXG_29265 [Rhizobium sp. LEGMi198b]
MLQEKADLWQSKPYNWDITALFALFAEKTTTAAKPMFDRNAGHFSVVRLERALADLAESGKPV